MADKKKMSVEDVLAACRRMDSGAGGPAASPSDGTETPASETPPSAPDTSAAAESPAKPAKGAAAKGPAAKEPAAKGPPAKPGAMSVTDILAAARAEKAAGAGQAGGAVPEGSSEEPAAPKAAGSSKPAPAKPGAMSVAEIMAAARGEKSGPQAKSAAEPKAGPAQAPAVKADKPAPKPAAEKPGKPAAGKPAAGKPAADKAAADKGSAGTATKDTASILAAARKSDKPGPISKAEAEAKGKPVTADKGGKRKLEVPPPPVKPAYAQPSPVAAGEPTNRRTFFAAVGGVFLGSSLAVGFSSLAVTHLLWALGLARFMFPNVLTEPPTRFKVGFPDDYAPGQVENKYKAQFGVWVVRSEYEGQPEIFALQAVCTHLGCTPNWLEGEQKFKCPCHGSGFYKDGINFEGPAPRPLERFAIRISDDGQLEVDKSRKFQEELGQWKDPASFVAV